MAVHSPFQVDKFVESVMDEMWESLELKARGRQVTVNLGNFLPADYAESIGILNEAVENYSGFCRFCFPDFVELYGLNDENWDLSINALERYTIGSSSEMAVRPFIIKNQDRMMAQMYVWSKHENEHVRRLSSEGCRPALPWAISLNSFKKDPTPILEQLKNDSSEYVRKSVANNLNDISKTHPDLVIKLATDWYDKNENTDWIVKHGCRTLLKKGNREALSIFGLQNADAVDVSEFSLSAESVSIGEDITFSFTISAKESTKVRLEYGIDYVKSSSKRNRKIFQISEIPLKENEKKDYKRKHSFADVSTRKHYPGTHSVTLIVNGTERGTLDFELRG